MRTCLMATVAMILSIATLISSPAAAATFAAAHPNGNPFVLSGSLEPIFVTRATDEQPVTFRLYEWQGTTFGARQIVSAATDPVGTTKQFIPNQDGPQLFDLGCCSAGYGVLPSGGEVKIGGFDVDFQIETFQTAILTALLNGVQVSRYQVGLGDSYGKLIQGGGHTPAPIPLPAAGWMLLSALGGLGLLGRRKARA